MKTPTSPSANRLFFLDWLRIAAFGLLIPYHVGMYYVSWTFHVKSPYASKALEPWMMLSSPWRMSLIFLIAGAASAIMLQGKTTGAMLRQRTSRLLRPLLAGMLLVIPPQTWFEVVNKFHYAGTFTEFLKLYYSGYHGFCDGGRCLDMPTWNHLWFLPYLWIYTCLLWLVMRLSPDGLKKVSSRPGPVAWLLLPWLVLLVFKLVLSGRFPQTYDVIHDLYSHAQFFFVFLLGACLAQRSDVWDVFARWRLAGLALALLSWAAFLASFAVAPGWLKQVLLVCEQWFALIAALGFARHYLNKDHPWRAVLTEAVFPVYIFHQTWIIVLTQVLRPLDWAPALEGPVIVLATFALSWLSYLLVRRASFMRIWFGLNREARS